MEIDSDSNGLFDSNIFSNQAVFKIDYGLFAALNDYVTTEGGEVKIIASVLTRKNDGISYNWNLDGDDIYEIATPNPEINYIWYDDHLGRIGLAVTDDTGLMATTTANVIINNVAPTVEAGDNINTQSGTPYNLTEVLLIRALWIHIRFIGILGTALQQKGH